MSTKMTFGSVRESFPTSPTTGHHISTSTMANSWFRIHPPVERKSKNRSFGRWQVFRTRAEARLAIRYWIEAWYNRRRISSVLRYLSPIEWEDHYRHTNTTAA